MKGITIAIASGKGGTGKTTVATNLALVASGKVCLADCDVEEPNDHIFVKPEWTGSERAAVPFPVVDENLCTGCGECRRACRFNAVVVMAKKPMFFPELCHSCGACTLACPTKAITETMREVGALEYGKRNGLDFIHGKVDIGEAKSPPLIEQVRKKCTGYDYVLIDSPPGAACPVVASVRGVDLCVLVTEPTPFGMNDASIVLDLIQQLGVKCAMVINRSDIGDDRTEKFCEEDDIPVLARIPFDRELAEEYSVGVTAVERFPRYEKLFSDLWGRIVSEVRK